MVGEPSTETGPRAVVDTFCDLLTYHEMMKVIADNSSGNGTSTDALPNVKTLVLQNLKDTCHWVRKMITQPPIASCAIVYSKIKGKEFCLVACIERHFAIFSVLPIILHRVCVLFL